MNLRHCLAFVVTCSFFVWMASVSSARPRQEFQSDVDEKQLPTGRVITPAGRSITFHGRPVDLQMGPNNRWLFVKDRGHLRIIDVERFKLAQSVVSPGGASLIGLGVASNGDVYFTNSKNGLHVFKVMNGDESGPNYHLAKTIALPANSFPCGIRLSADESQAYVCLSKLNQVAIVDLKSGMVEKQIDVGIAPFDLAVDDESQSLVVTNMGGRRPLEGDRVADSAGSETVVDEKGIASTGTASVIDLKTGKVIRHLTTGLHPSSIIRDSKRGTWMAVNSNSDTMTFWDNELRAAHRWFLKPDEKLPFGSMPSGLGLTPDGRRLLVALAGNNCLAIIDPPLLAKKGESEMSLPEAKIHGFVPTAWFPVAIAFSETHLFVANLKGNGARSRQRDSEKGWNSHDHLGLIQKIELARLSDSEQLSKWTQVVKTNGRIQQILRASLATSDPNAQVKPTPIPKS